MCRKSFISVIILYLCLNYSHLYRLDEEVPKDFSWNYLILSQHWPVTNCISWTQHKPQHHCAFPNKKDRWTLHGIWPGSLEIETPEFCNNSWGFDPGQIKPIENELEQAWTNIFKESPRYGLWEHEWNKHGTCATTLKALNTQLKYFSKGIEWNKQYTMLEILKASNIHPSNTRKLTAEELGNAVRSKTRKQPTVVCFTANGVQYLDELRICFDKKLNLIECDSLVFKTCDTSKGIIYPETP